MESMMVDLNHKERVLFIRFIINTHAQKTEKKENKKFLLNLFLLFLTKSFLRIYRSESFIEWRRNFSLSLSLALRFNLIEMIAYQLERDDNITSKNIFHQYRMEINARSWARLIYWRFCFICFFLLKFNFTTAHLAADKAANGKSLTHHMFDTFVKWNMFNSVQQ